MFYSLPNMTMILYFHLGTIRMEHWTSNCIEAAWHPGIGEKFLPRICINPQLTAAIMADLSYHSRLLEKNRCPLSFSHRYSCISTCGSMRPWVRRGQGVCPDRSRECARKLTGEWQKPKRQRVIHEREIFIVAYGWLHDCTFAKKQTIYDKL